MSACNFRSFCADWQMLQPIEPEQPQNPEDPQQNPVPEPQIPAAPLQQDLPQQIDPLQEEPNLPEALNRGNQAEENPEEVLRRENFRGGNQTENKNSEGNENRDHGSQDITAHPIQNSRELWAERRGLTEDDSSETEDDASIPEDLSESVTYEGESSDNFPVLESSSPPRDSQKNAEDEKNPATNSEKEISESLAQSTGPEASSSKFDKREDYLEYMDPSKLSFVETGKSLGDFDSKTECQICTSLIKVTGKRETDIEALRSAKGKLPKNASITGTVEFRKRELDFRIRFMSTTHLFPYRSITFRDLGELFELEKDAKKPLRRCLVTLYNEFLQSQSEESTQILCFALLGNDLDEKMSQCARRISVWQKLTNSDLDESGSNSQPSQEDPSLKVFTVNIVKSISTSFPEEEEEEENQKSESNSQNSQNFSLDNKENPQAVLDILKEMFDPYLPSKSPEPSVQESTQEASTSRSSNSEKRENLAEGKEEFQGKSPGEETQEKVTESQEKISDPNQASSSKIETEDEIQAEFEGEEKPPEEKKESDHRSKALLVAILSDLLKLERSLSSYVDEFCSRKAHLQQWSPSSEFFPSDHLLDSRDIGEISQMYKKISRGSRKLILETKLELGIPLAESERMHYEELTQPENRQEPERDQGENLFLSFPFIHNAYLLFCMNLSNLI